MEALWYILGFAFAGVSFVFLTIAAAEKYTGISEESIRRLISAGKLQALRPVRGRIVLDRVALDSFVLGCNARPRTGRGQWRR